MRYDIYTRDGCILSSGNIGKSFVDETKNKKFRDETKKKNKKGGCLL